MPKNSKKSTIRLQVDDSETGAVFPCPLCSRRIWEPDPLAAWKSLYNHLRRHHNSARAAELTQRVRKRIARMNWETRQKESSRSAQ